MSFIQTATTCSAKNTHKHSLSVLCAVVFICSKAHTHTHTAAALTRSTISQSVHFGKHYSHWPAGELPPSSADSAVLRGGMYADGRELDTIVCTADDSGFHHSLRPAACFFCLLLNLRTDPSPFWGLDMGCNSCPSCFQTSALLALLAAAIHYSRIW